jgi:hypothetical protein
MMKWINSTLLQLASDNNVIWKASAMHHMMWGAHDDDITPINKFFYPLVK